MVPGSRTLQKRTSRVRSSPEMGSKSGQSSRKTEALAGPDGCSQVYGQSSFESHWGSARLCDVVFLQTPSDIPQVWVPWFCDPRQQLSSRSTTGEEELFPSQGPGALPAMMWKSSRAASQKSSRCAFCSLPVAVLLNRFVGAEYPFHQCPANASHLSDRFARTFFLSCLQEKLPLYTFFLRTRKKTYTVYTTYTYIYIYAYMYICICRCICICIGICLCIIYVYVSITHTHIYTHTWYGMYVATPS